MRLADFLTPGCVALNYSAPDKWTAIRDLIDRIVADGGLPAALRTAVLEALTAREHIASTGLAGGIALPHASVPGLERPVAAVAVSPAGVPFQSEDGEPARLVFLVAIPKRNPQMHVRMLAGVARLLSSEDMRRSLVAARTPEEVLAIIRREEEQGVA